MPDAACLQFNRGLIQQCSQSLKGSDKATSSNNTIAGNAALQAAAMDCWK